MSKLGWFALGSLIAVGVLAQRLPDIGEWMALSRDLRNVLSGCTLKYDASRREFVCATSAVGGTIIDVTLTAGSSTTVSNNAISATSRLICGCTGPGGPGAELACNTGGRWIRGLTVASTDAGQAVLQHGMAIGDETVQCVVTDA